MPEAAQAKSGGSKLAWLLVIGLLGTVWWLASERNARRFSYESHAGELVISKGRYFPTGTGTIGPGDPQGKSYAGIVLPPGTKTIAETEFEDEAALDRALFDLLSGWARTAAQKHEPQSQQQAEELVTRLTGLAGLTPAQLGDLQALRAELGWWSAGKDLEAALKTLAAARRKLEEVRRGDVEHATQAGALLGPLEAISVQLADLAAGRAAAAAAAAAAATPVNSGPAGSVAGAQGAAAPGPGADGGAAAAPMPDAGSAAKEPAPAQDQDAGTAASGKPRGHASAPGSVSSGAPRGDGGHAP